MKASLGKLVIQQPTKRMEKTVIEMKDQNDNQEENAKVEQFLVKQPPKSDSRKRAKEAVYCSDGIVELDENGNPVQIEKKKRNVVLQPVWSNTRLGTFLISIDSPILNSASNFGSTVSRKTISTIDCMGNAFASIIGITGAKYGNEIAQANYEEKERKRRENVIRDAGAGWK